MRAMNFTDYISELYTNVWMNCISPLSSHDTKADGSFALNQWVKAEIKFSLIYGIGQNLHCTDLS